MDKAILVEPICRGIGIGQAYVHNTFKPDLAKTIIPEDEVSNEISKFKEIKKSSIVELNGIREFFGASDLEKSRIFKAHIDIINDPFVEQTIISTVKEKRVVLSYAIYETYEVFFKILQDADSIQNRARIADLLDCRNRLLRNYEGIKEKTFFSINTDTVIIAKELLPSEVMTINKQYIKGIITEIGSKTSHVAILSKNYDIPAFIGTGEIIKDIDYGDNIIIDSLSNVVVINPSDDRIREYKKLEEEFKLERKKLQSYLDCVPITQDGKKITVEVNLNFADNDELKIEPFVDGVGLFRSEFLFFQRNQAPSLNEQFLVYKKLLTKFKGKEVVIRTMDVGADKRVDYLNIPFEDNPALGNRGIRFCFSNQEVFETQLKALLKASAYGELSIMIPMISTVDEIKRTKKILKQVEKELKDAGEQIGNYKFGIMIETPAIALDLGNAVGEVDFASIGTNDLTQYLLAVDRFDNKVSAYYQTLSPIVIKVIENCVKIFKEHNKPISVCGEIASDEFGLKVLIGLGVDKISIAKSTLPLVKKNISELKFSDSCVVARNLLLKL